MDCRVDKYIANSREFARPILEKVRKAALKSSSRLKRPLTGIYFVGNKTVWWLVSEHLKLTFVCPSSKEIL